MAGFLIAMLVLCNPDDTLPNDKTETKVEVRYRYVTTVDTFVDHKPVLKYKYIKKDSLIYIPTSESSQIIPEFKPSDYQYIYERSFWTDGNRIRNDIKANGWGKLENLESTFTVHDTLADSITTTITAKYRVPNALYFSGSYIWNPYNQKAIKMGGLDYTIEGTAILGVSAGLNEENQPIIGGKVGLKIH